MACMSDHHKESWPMRPGCCSVPMWMNGMPAGFCDEPAWGAQTKEYLESFRYIDPQFKKPSYAPGLACPHHGGPKEPSPVQVQEPRP